MSMTVKQLANSLGVSKTAIRKRFNDEFRANHLQINESGILIIDDNGCKLIAETLQTTANQIPEMAQTNPERFAETPQTTANQIPETVETTENMLLETLKTTITTLQQHNTLLSEQLTIKDKQIAAQQEQIKTLTESLSNSTTAVINGQVLQLAASQKQLTEKSECSDDVEAPVVKRYFWQRWFNKK